MYLNIQKASIKIGPLECKGKSEAMNNGGSCQSLKSQGRSSGYYILDTSQDNRYTEDSYRYSRQNLVMQIFVFFVKTLLLLRFQSSNRHQMKYMKIRHSMVHLDF